MGAAEFTEKYLIKCEDKDCWKPSSQPCQFLGNDNLCTVYEVRPASCAEYSHTDKPEFASRTYLHADNALHCPAVFYIIEQMRARGLR